MAFQRQLVLFRAGDAPGLDHEFRALAHRQARCAAPRCPAAPAANAQAQAEPGAEPLARGLAAIALEQQLLETLGKDHRRIADRVDPAGDGAVDLSERDLVAEENRGLEARAAGALQVEARRFRGEPAAEHRFARQIPLAGVLHDRAGRDLVQTLALQAEALDDAAQRRGQHFLIADLRVGAVAARERNAHAADDRDATRRCSDQHT